MLRSHVSSEPHGKKTDYHLGDGRRAPEFLNSRHVRR
ncbi:hypothetical protein EYF80_066137 [Liparis tanakae]|uniref:Uncharacterized protein n=1 Tax=Liparis tanakae TaxID=230148 RepID=A0A4Z2E4S1_9TELE|nr:hypothetical protein EYF80_066137 [Liparis tanakae]